MFKFADITFQEEALEAFVEPEILNGQNQYFCEKCNRKVDAHKVSFRDFRWKVPFSANACPITVQLQVFLSLTL